MPTQLFYTTQIPVSLWFLSKNKKQPGKTLFVDARKVCRILCMTTGDIKKGTDAWTALFDWYMQAAVKMRSNKCHQRSCIS